MISVVSGSSLTVLLVSLGRLFCLNLNSTGETLVSGYYIYILLNNVSASFFFYIAEVFACLLVYKTDL